MKYSWRTEKRRRTIRVDIYEKNIFFNSLFILRTTCRWQQIHLVARIRLWIVQTFVAFRRSLFMFDNYVAACKWYRYLPSILICSHERERSLFSPSFKFKVKKESQHFIAIETIQTMNEDISRVFSRFLCSKTKSCSSQAAFQKTIIVALVSVFWSTFWPRMTHISCYTLHFGRRVNSIVIIKNGISVLKS